MKHLFNKIVFILFFISCYFNNNAQVPLVKAFKYYSGITDRQLIFYDFKPIRNNGLIAVGADSTQIGTTPGLNKETGERPVIVKFDSSGNVIWKKNIYVGDSATNNSFASVVETDDGGYVAVGKVEMSASLTQLLLMKFNSSGDVVWQRVYGGSLEDNAYEIRTVSSGGFIIVGSTGSNNGNVSGNHGGIDIWLLRVNEDGSVRWSKCFGGSNNEFGFSVTESADFGFVVAGSTASNNGNLAGNSILGGWVFNTDSSGNLLWQKAYGDSFNDQFRSVRIAGDYSIILAGQSYVGGAAGKSVFWTTKLTPTGNLLWSKKNDGARGLEDVWAHTIQPLFDNSVLISGTEASLDINGGGIVFSPLLMKLSPYGDLIWKMSTGGNQRIWSYQSLFIRENEYITIGSETNFGRGILYRLGSANSIKGQLYLDANSNNSKDAGETIFNNALVTVKKNNIEIIAANPYNGYFEMPVDTGAYVTSLQLFNPYYTVVPSSRNSSFSSYLNIDSFSFAVQPIPNKQDLIVHLIPVSPARPGFKAQYVLNYKNIGTTAIASGSVKLIKDSRTTFALSLPFPSSVVADTITWNYSNLKPLDSVAIGLEFQLAPPPTLNINDTLKYSAIVLPVINDLTPANDTSFVNQRVQGSYDPNDKQENFAGRMPLRKVQEGACINYVIRFQNTGNDTAFTVRLLDTLESKLDWTSFQMIGSSHKYNLTIKEGNKLQWVFNDIKLPDSTTNLLRSIGFVSFRIKPKSNVVTNDIIKNKASIYFDYNLPIITNSADVTIANDVLTAIREVQNNEMQLQLGPNPTTSYSNLLITGKLKGRFELRIIDNNGRIISQQTIIRNSIAETNNVPVHLEKLSSGVYYIQLQQKGKSWWQKIILQ